MSWNCTADDPTPLQQSVLRVFYRYASKMHRSPDVDEVRRALPSKLQDQCATAGHLAFVTKTLEKKGLIAKPQTADLVPVFLPKCFDRGWLPRSIPLISIHPHHPTSMLTEVVGAKLGIVTERDNAQNLGVFGGDILVVGDSGGKVEGLFVDVPHPNGEILKAYVDDGFVRIAWWDHKQSFAHTPNFAHHLLRWKILSVLRDMRPLDGGAE
jgi:hypothetical protein